MPIYPQNMDKVKVYPNPCHLNDDDPQIIFSNYTENSTISIFTISGNLVYKVIPQQGKSEWDLINNSAKKIASGVYIYTIIDNIGNKKIGKIAIIP